MLEIKVTLEAPDLSQALKQLAAAIDERNKSIVLHPDSLSVPLEKYFVNDPGIAISTTPATVQATEVPPVPMPTVPTTEVPPVPMPTVPVQQEMMNPPVTPVQKTMSLDLSAIARAGAAFIDQDGEDKKKMNALLALLEKYGVKAINQLDPSQYDAFAADMRILGANI